MSIYGSPEDHGVEIVGTVDWYGGDGYEWDMTVVLRDPKGRLYWDDDAGCSCNSPFMDHYSLDDFETGTMMDLSNHLVARRADAEQYDRPMGYIDGEIAELMKAVMF